MTNRGSYISKIYSKKRETKEQKIVDVLRDFLSYYHLDASVNEEDIINAWKEITGELIFKLTTKIYIENSCLYVSVNSPALKNELMLVRTNILKKIKEKLPECGLNNIYIK